MAPTWLQPVSWQCQLGKGTPAVVGVERTSVLPLCTCLHSRGRARMARQGQSGRHPAPHPSQPPASSPNLWPSQSHLLPGERGEEL